MKFIPRFLRVRGASTATQLGVLRPVAVMRQRSRQGQHDWYGLLEQFRRRMVEKQENPSHNP